MRNHLRLIKTTLGLHWGYSRLGTLDKTQHYNQRLKAVLQTTTKGLYETLTADPRNMSLKQLLFKKRVTLLANTDKKTFSGFDLKLAGIKSPKLLKKQRRAPLLTLKQVSFHRTPQGTTLAAEFVNAHVGWGRKSSSMLGFLANRSFNTFTKAKSARSPVQGNSFPGTLLPCLPLLASAEESYRHNIAPEANFLLTTELHTSSVVSEKAFCEFNGESPNLAPLTTTTLLPIGDFNAICKTHLIWSSGLLLTPKPLGGRPHAANIRNQLMVRFITL